MADSYPNCTSSVSSSCENDRLRCDNEESVVVKHHGREIAKLKHDFIALRDASMHVLEQSLSETARVQHQNAKLRARILELESVKSCDAHSTSVDKKKMSTRPENANAVERQAEDACKVQLHQRELERSDLKSKFRGYRDLINNLQETVQVQAQVIKGLRSELDGVLLEESKLKKEREDQAVIISEQNKKLNDHSMTIANMLRSVKMQSQASFNLRSELSRLKSAKDRELSSVICDFPLHKKTPNGFERSIEKVDALDGQYPSSSQSSSLTGKCA